MLKNIIIVIISFFVPMVFLYYVYSKDSIKENFMSLVKAFFAGVFSVIIVSLLYSLIRNLPLENIKLPVTLLNVVKAFLRDGVIEEAVKLLMFISLFRYSKDYDDAYDGIVFFAFLGIGFAVFENVLYLISNNLDTEVLLFRTFTALPLHFYMGVFMGYYYSRYLVNKARGKNYTNFLIYAYLMPVLLHGIHNFVNLSFIGINYEYKSIIHILILGVFFATITYIAFMNIEKSSLNDIRIQKMNNKERVFCSKCGLQGISGEFCTKCGTKL